MEKVDIIYSYEVLRQAEKFKKATEILKESEIADIAIPAEVNASLACELYLKFLVYFQSNKEIEVKEIQKMKWHKLNDLLKKVPEDFQKEIANNMELTIEEVSEKLNDVGNNFSKIRYEYEFEKITYSFGFLYHLMLILDDICQRVEKD